MCVIPARDFCGVSAVAKSEPPAARARSGAIVTLPRLVRGWAGSLGSPPLLPPLNSRGPVTTPSALIKVMFDAVRKAARGLTRDFGEVGELQVSKKGPGRLRLRRRPEGRADAVRGAERGAAGLWLPGRGTRPDRRQRQDPHLDRRPARRHHQLPARHSALRHHRRAGARGPDRRRGDLQSDHQRAVLGREGPRRLLNDKRLRVAGAPRPGGGGDRHRHPLHRPRRPRAVPEGAAPDQRSGSPACAASARRRWTWPLSRPAASTASGSAACGLGHGGGHPAGERGRRHGHRRRGRRRR